MAFAAIVIGAIRFATAVFSRPLDDASVDQKMDNTLHLWEGRRGQI